VNIKLLGTQQNFIVESGTLVTYLNLELPDGGSVLAMITEEDYVRVLQALRGAAPPSGQAERTVVFGGDARPEPPLPAPPPQQVVVREKGEEEDLFEGVDEESRPRFGKSVPSRTVPQDENGYPLVAQRAPIDAEDEDGVPSL